MIIFENEAVLVLDKRPGFLSVLSRLGTNDSRPCEFSYWQKRKGVRLWSVHRLDEEVSGLLMLAKNPKAHSLLSQAFESKEVKKTYHAWTEVPQTSFPAKEQRLRWESRLLRGKKRAYEKPFGKEAITEAVLKGERQGVLEWELFPLTGRSHQLRFECYKHGFPIVGDELYGSKQSFAPSKGIALRAIALDFQDFADRKALDLPTRLEATRIDEWLSSPVNAD